LALIAALGPPIAFLVYVCTVAGLALSYAVGRLLPIHWLIQATEAAGLRRTSRLLTDIEPLDRAGRLAYLASVVPGRRMSIMLRYRYLALALMLNIPGNFLIGGGGGIALVAGISRLYSVPGFLATIAIAVSPVPIAVIIFGSEILGR
jgi:hypothetical protein